MSKQCDMVGCDSTPSVLIRTGWCLEDAQAAGYPRLYCDSHYHTEMLTKLAHPGLVVIVNILPRERRSDG